MLYYVNFKNFVDFVKKVLSGPLEFVSGGQPNWISVSGYCVPAPQVL